MNFKIPARPYNVTSNALLNDIDKYFDKNLIEIFNK